MDSATALPRARLAYIDWLRFLVVLSLAPFHGAIIFEPLGGEDGKDAPPRGVERGSLDSLREHSRKFALVSRVDDTHRVVKGVRNDDEVTALHRQGATGGPQTWRE